MPTFKRNLSEEETAALRAVDSFLTTGLGTDPAGRRRGETTHVTQTTISPGGASVVIKLDGPRAITGVNIQLDPGHLKANPDALRETVIRIYWDKEKVPSVEVPLIDFFGTAPGVNYYRSLPRCV